jgi:negative regulator of replication initiation
MPQIEIDGDLFEYLKAHQGALRESPSDLSRRLLRRGRLQGEAAWSGAAARDGFA